ncbi:hypothetical protein G6011_05021 [Alternaria panax]|uniref:C2H2-type domain-containing protein n=1 Tax=Alternaria panax TaxID=48097 RepID=A0AAD4FC07_9PLEO|nr:hypothetical protein G6011_05021 [Alternaria panax]
MPTLMYPNYNLRPQHNMPSCPAPWSQVNTHLEYEFVEYRAKELHQDRHAHVIYRNGIPLRPKETTQGHLLLSNAESDPRPYLLRAPSVSSPTLTSWSDHVLRCGQCHVAFTGAYGKGNLGRHMRHKHALIKEAVYKCTVSGCDKTFARKDAMLKHARKQHPGLHSEPVKRKRDNEAKATNPLRKIGGGSAIRCRPDNGSAWTNGCSGLDTDGTYARMVHATKTTGSSGQQMGRSNQTTGAAVSAYQIEARPLQFADHNDSSAASTYRETHSSLHHLPPPCTDWNYGHTSAPKTVTDCHSSTGMSTQPSSHGFDTAPSSYFHPMHSEATAVQDLEDSMSHSPLTSLSSNHSRTLQSGASPYITPHHTPLSQRSLSGGYFQAIPGSDTNIDLSHIDPVLFQQPFEWPHSLDEELE